jgi:hypothetical protein
MVASNSVDPRNSRYRVVGCVPPSLKAVHKEIHRRIRKRSNGELAHLSKSDIRALAASA